MWKVIVIIMVLVMVGCVDTAKEGGKQYQSNIGIRDYGNGVFYFNYTEGDFAKALSGFSETHKVISICPNTPPSSQGGAFGYFVVAEEK